MELATGCSGGWWGKRRLGGRVMLLSWGLLAFGCGEGPVEEAVEEPVEDQAAILSTDSLDFGSVEVHLSTVRSFVLRNPSSLPLRVTFGDLESLPGAFAILYPSLLGGGLDLPPYTEELFGVSFAPAEAGSFEYRLVIESGGASSSILFEGEGVRGTQAIGVHPSILEIGLREDCTFPLENLWVFNYGSEVLTLLDVEFTSSDGCFTLRGLPGLPFPLAPGELLPIGVEVTSELSFSDGIISISSDDAEQDRLSVLVTDSSSENRRLFCERESGDADGDGYAAEDCNDRDPEAYPGSMACGTGGADRNCDGVPDNLTIECCEPLIECHDPWTFTAELSCESEPCAWVVEYEEEDETGCPVYAMERCTYPDRQWVSKETRQGCDLHGFVDRTSLTLDSSLGGACTCSYAD